ncbi:MAG: NAD(P)-binding protein [Myxococcota bacterium]
MRRELATDVDVMVLGAGIAGLACAERLLEGGCSVTLVELVDEVCTRSWMKVDLDGTPIGGDALWWPVVEKLRRQSLNLPDPYLFDPPLPSRRTRDGHWTVRVGFANTDVRQVNAKDLVVGTMGEVADHRQLGVPNEALGQWFSRCAWSDAFFIEDTATVYVAGHGVRAQDQIRWIRHFKPRVRIEPLLPGIDPQSLDAPKMIVDGREADQRPNSLSWVPQEGVWWASPRPGDRFEAHAAQRRAGHRIASAILDKRIR